MNLTRRQLKAQYDRAVSLGWLPYFEEATKITKGYFDVADLLAIGSRETNLDPKWLRRKGDNGHGCGLMQIDDRSFPEFTSSTKWQDARLGILKGAEVLMQKWHDYENNIGKRVSVKGSTFTAKAASGATAQHIVISSYNCGRWAQFCFARGLDIDKYSTGKDYGRDVMERAAVIRSFLTSAATSMPASPSLPLVGQDALAPEPVDSQTDQPVAPPTQAEGQTIVDVPPVTTEPPEGIVSKIKTWYAALPAFLLSMLGGFWSWLQGAATEIIVAFLVSAGIVAIVFIWTNYKARQNDKERDFKAKEAQKIRDFELTKIQMLSAMDPKKQTVRVAPPPVVVPNSDEV